MHLNAKRVLDALASSGSSAQVIELAASTCTSAEAAAGSSTPSQLIFLDLSLVIYSFLIIDGAIQRSKTMGIMQQEPVLDPEHRIQYETCSRDKDNAPGRGASLGALIIGLPLCQKVGPREGDGLTGDVDNGFIPTTKVMLRKKGARRINRIVCDYSFCYWRRNRACASRPGLSILWWMRKPCIGRYDSPS